VICIENGSSNNLQTGTKYVLLFCFPPDSHQSHNAVYRRTGGESRQHGIYVAELTTCKPYKHKATNKPLSHSHWQRPSWRHCNSKCTANVRQCQPSEE